MLQDIGRKQHSPIPQRQQLRNAGHTNAVVPHVHTLRTQRNWSSGNLEEEGWTMCQRENYQQNKHQPYDPNSVLSAITE